MYVFIFTFLRDIQEFQTTVDSLKFVCIASNNNEILSTNIGVMYHLNSIF